MRKVSGQLLWSCLVACSATGPTSTGFVDGGGLPTGDTGVVPTGDVPGTASGTVTLDLSSQTVSGIPIGGGEGSYQYTAQVVLINVSVTTPISLVSSLFSLTTDGARVVTPTMVTGCSSTERLAVGGRAMCGLQFTLSTPQRPVTIAYDDGAGHAASVAAQPVQFTPAPIDYCVAAERYSASGEACTGCLERSCRTELVAQSNAFGNLGVMRDDVLSCVSRCEGGGGTPTTRCSCQQACSEPWWLASTGVSACMINNCASNCR